LSGVGNRLTMAVDGGDPMEYAYDNANKMQSAGTTTFVYDSNGNTRTKTEPGIGQTGYVYNYENKITTILYPSGRGVSNYLYDGDGVRRKKVDATGTRWFVYDGANLIAETDALGNLQAVYTYGVDGLVSSRAGGQSYFYHFDGLGSTRAMTDANAQLVDVYDYEAFGNELLSQGALATPYRYVGQLGYYRHDDVGLDLLGARYYAPEFGRFLTRDPLGQDDDPNVYVYCSDDPVNEADPLGLLGWPRRVPNALEAQPGPIPAPPQDPCDTKGRGDCFKCNEDQWLECKAKCVKKYKFKPRKLWACLTKCDLGQDKCSKECGQCACDKATEGASTSPECVKGTLKCWKPIMP
jgi:RHS repeat-associated protein